MMGGARRAAWRRRQVGQEKVGRAAGLVVLVVAGVVLGLRAPMPVPDTHTRTGASASAEVNDWTSVANSFWTDRDGLYRIDVALSTLERTDSAELQFYVREGGPKGRIIRELHRSLMDLPEGKVLDLYSTRWRDLPWVSFQFEPLYGYAGKELCFSVEGKGIPLKNTVQVLFAYHNDYPRGEAFTSAKAANARMVFRTFTRGTLAELLGMTFPLLARGRPGFLGWQWVYEAAAAAVVALAVLLFAAIAGLRGHEGRR